MLGLSLAVERVPLLAPLRILHPLARSEALAGARSEPAATVGEAKITHATETRAELSLPDSAALRSAQSALAEEQAPGDVALPTIDAAEPPARARRSRWASAEWFFFAP